MMSAKVNYEQAPGQAIKGVKKIDAKPEQGIPVIGSGNVPYRVDITSVLLQQPSSPFAIVLSISIVLGAITRLIKTLKPR
jgi:hypothetical protein